MFAASLLGNRSVGLKDGENVARDWENNAGMLFELGMEMSVCCSVLPQTSHRAETKFISHH